MDGVLSSQGGAVAEATCRVCHNELTTTGAGRPPRYCSAACRQRAYRARQRVLAPEPTERVRRPRRPKPAQEPIERAVPHLTAQELLAWRGILEVQSVVLPALEAELRQELGLVLSEFDVLYQLWRMPDKQRRMVDLARALLVTAGGVTRIVSRLEKRGLVERVSASGRQAVITRLTRRGERELQAAMDVHFDGVRRMFLRHLSHTDIDRIVGLWNRIRDARTGEAAHADGSPS
jgi:DNA-binding MarR family transcriptional regulator